MRPPSQELRDEWRGEILSALTALESTDPKKRAAGCDVLANFCRAWLRCGISRETPTAKKIRREIQRA